MENQTHPQTSPGPTERRIAERLPVQQVVLFRCSGGDRMSAILTNLTTAGCRVVGAPDLVEGDSVWVWIAHLEGRRTQVVWTAEGAAGLSFADPLHPAVVTHIGAQGGSPAPAQQAPANDSYQWQARRERTLGNCADAPRILRAKSPRGGSAMEGMIRRNTARLVELRREPRYPAPEDAADTLQVGGAFAQVEDISRSGVRIRGGIDKTIGQRVVSQFMGCEPISGRVAWKRGDLVGIALPGNSIDLHEDQ